MADEPPSSGFFFLLRAHLHAAEYGHLPYADAKRMGHLGRNGVTASSNRK